MAVDRQCLITEDSFKIWQRGNCRWYDPPTRTQRREGEGNIKPKSACGYCASQKHRHDFFHDSCQYHYTTRQRNGINTQ